MKESLQAYIAKGNGKFGTMSLKVFNKIQRLYVNREKVLTVEIVYLCSKYYM